MKRTIFGSSIIVLFIMTFLSINANAQLGFRPRHFTLGNVDLMGGGVWNWEQSIPQSWENIAINGDMSYWPDGASGIPYGMSSTYSNINCIVSREDTLVKVGTYALRITANGSPEGYSDYRWAMKQEWEGRYMSLGFWYFCPSSNDQNQEVLFNSWSLGASNPYKSIELLKDNSWHWAHLVIVPRRTATSLILRILVNEVGGASDTDDYIIIDGLTMMEGRIVTRWSMSYWDYLYKAGLIMNGSHWGFNTNPDTSWYSAFYHSIYLKGPAPTFLFDDTDFSNKRGLFRIGSDAGFLFFDWNNSPTGNFSPYQRWFVYDSLGVGMGGAVPNDSLRVYMHGRMFADTLSIPTSPASVPKEGDTYVGTDSGTGNHFLYIYYKGAWRSVQVSP